MKFVKNEEKTFCQKVFNLELQNKTKYNIVLFKEQFNFRVEMASTYTSDYSLMIFNSKY